MTTLGLLAGTIFISRVTIKGAVMKQPDYSGYESAKQRWIANNPNHTPEEYQRAMRKIAARYGV